MRNPDETHVSPDGDLTLLVFRGDEPEVRLGGVMWSVDGRTLSRLAPGGIDAAVTLFVRDVLTDVLPIAIWTRSGETTRAEVVQDRWWTGKFDIDEYLEMEAESMEAGDCLRVRCWSSAETIGQIAAEPER